MIISLAKLGQVHAAAQAHDKSADSFAEALEIAQALKAAGKFARDIDELIGALDSDHRRASVARRALDPWDMLMKQPADQLPELLDYRAVELSEQGRMIEAARAAAKLCELDHVQGSQLYNAACVFCRCAAAIERDAGERLSQQQSAQRQQFVDDALATLQRAIGAGWDNFAHMNQDSDLDILRDHPEFQQLIRQ